MANLGDVYILDHTLHKMGFVVASNPCLYPWLWSQRRMPPALQFYLRHLAIGDFGTPKG